MKNNVEIMVCYKKETDPFIFGIWRLISLFELERIEKDLVDNKQEIFNKGEGDYSFEIFYDDGGWSFKVVDFCSI